MGQQPCKDTNNYRPARWMCTWGTPLVYERASRLPYHVAAHEIYYCQALTIMQPRIFQLGCCDVLLSLDHHVHTRRGRGIRLQLLQFIWFHARSACKRAPGWLQAVNVLQFGFRTCRRPRRQGLLNLRTRFIRITAELSC
jgi:hypothetical protein